MKQAFATLSMLVMFLLISTQAQAIVFEFNQCQRKCKETFGAKTNGEAVSREQCRCFIENNPNPVTIARYNTEDPPQLGLEVCAHDGTTFASQALAEATHAQILHRGACGQCSNEQDIDLYRRTKDTLTDDTTYCAMENLMWGEDQANACFSKIGFTPGCSRCWVDNIGCTSTHCLLTCLWEKFKGSPNNLPDGTLNPCLACDENFCGKPFIKCAGANRRRAGIISDIGRNETEIWTR